MSNLGDNLTISRMQSKLVWARKRIEKKGSLDKLIHHKCGHEPFYMQKVVRLFITSFHEGCAIL